MVGGPRNTIWFGTDHGILIKKKKEVSSLKIDGSELQENVKVIHFDTDSSLWIGTDQGVTQYTVEEDAYQFNQYHSHPNINESEVSSVHVDVLGRVWIGYLSAGLVVFDGTDFHDPNVPEPLKNIAAIEQDPYGNIWIATEGSGLFKVTAMMYFSSNVTTTE